jgi:hypothetical protein
MKIKERELKTILSSRSFIFSTEFFIKSRRFSAKVSGKCLL